MDVRRWLCVVALFGSLVLSTGVAHALIIVDTIDGTGAGTFTGTLAAPDTVDWYSFQTVGGGVHIHIEILSTTLSSGPGLILDGKSSPVVPGDLHDPGSPGSLAFGKDGSVLSPIDGGIPDWFWVVGVQSDTLVGSYTLQISQIFDDSPGSILPIAGDQTSLVPEPSSLAFLSAALVSLVLGAGLRLSASTAR